MTATPIYEAVREAVAARDEGMAEAVMRYLDRCAWSGDCLVPPGIEDRYGEVAWGPRKSRTRMVAHRAVYLAMCGPVDRDEVVRHHCDNPPCCNPAHLKAGTQSQNIRDMYSRNRRDGLPAGAAGEANRSAVLTDALVAQLRREARAGVGVRQVARQHGLQYSSVQQAVRGKTWRHVEEPPVPQVRPSRPSPFRTPSDVVDRAREMAAAGHSLAEIGDELGLNRVTVHRALNREAS